MNQESQKRIMILDDEPFTVQSLVERLRFEGFEVELTDRPQRCLERARKVRFDLFILDVDLGPGAPPHLPDGLAVARVLRKERATVNVPIVGITGIQAQRRDEALSLGMVKFYLKPLRLDAVIPALRALFESRKKAKEATASWLVETAGEEWNVLEMVVSEGYAKLRSTLVAGEGPLSLQGRDLSLALRLIHQGKIDTELFEEIGVRLYDGLFPPQANVGLQQCRLLAQLAQQPLRFLIRIEDSLWEHLPWELCRYTGGTHGGHWLGGDPYLTCSRLASNSGPLKPDEVLRRPLKILVVGPSPAGGAELDMAGELNEIHAALSSEAQDSGTEWQFLGPSWIEEIPPELSPVAEASPANVNEALLRFRPHIVHFIAHGLQGALVLEEGGFRKEWADFFLHLDLVGKGVRLLVINSCLSGHPGTASPGLALAGATAGVTAVAGHLYQVSDRAARRFAKLLYQELARGEAIDRAFQTARSRVWSEELQEKRPFLPLLFVRDQFLRLDLGTAGG